MLTEPSGPMRTRKQGNENLWRARILDSTSTGEKGHKRKSKEKLAEMSHIKVGCS